ncbi:GlxA family transcriptional regulator [Rhizobium sp. L51/94]|uniref:GlxA family transcriptional regulator n=1 Tax=Rhizobium sp. L51/94 TaxID=2819999 RepID=UPI001C5BEE57|nr:GlxA family transcriptional regulator [Rhizobium sp. L51/94]QXZ80482.1 GlxA family transcriptional regulator [Rhizobium sp. L51/94]
MNDIVPSIHAKPLVIGFFVFPRFQLLDLSGPLAAFQMANAASATELYEMIVLSRTGDAVATTASIDISTTRVDAEAVRLDTLVVVGGSGARAADLAELDAISGLVRRARRITSVCTGAFLLAATGLLDGRRATTHWRHAARLQRDYPRIRVEADRIHVEDGPVWTSAGITAGIDLALALIQADHGIALSKAVARELVVEHRRSGGQSQHSEMIALDSESERIGRVLAYARSHLDRPLYVEHLAKQASLSLRQFNRLFRAQTGETPAKAIERLRVEAAKPRIEAGIEPVEMVATAVGFTDPERMRRAFIRRFGHPPQSLRRAARDQWPGSE